MKKNDLFLWTVNLEGDIDIAFYVWVKNVERFYEKWEKFFELYRQYILRQEFYLSINMIHYPMKILKDYILQSGRKKLLTISEGL